MKRLVSSMVLGAFLAGMLHAPALAAKPGKAKKDRDQVFKKRDHNNDGTLSLAEFEGKGKKKKDEAKVGAKFKKLDKDKDGKLSLVEFKTTKKKKK
jgi:hypothetical protein